MIIEHASLRVTPGRERDFEAAMVPALVIIESAPGCHGAEVRAQLEDPSNYLLLVRWASLAAHGDFRASALYEQWRTLTHHFYVEPPEVRHYGEPLAR